MKNRCSHAARLAMLGVFVCGSAWGQASDPPPTTGRGISQIDEMTRQHEAGKLRPDVMATLELTYTGSGDLRSRLVKHGLYSIFPAVEVGGAQVKRLANSEKIKVQEAVESGQIDVTALWAKTGVRAKAKCSGDLEYGFQKVIFIPFGGPGNFSCFVESRSLPDETMAAWKSGLQEAETAAVGECSSTHPAWSGELWKCVVEAGVSLPLD